MHICDPNTPTMRLEEELGEYPEARGPASLAYEVVHSKKFQQ